MPFPPKGKKPSPTANVKNTVPPAGMNVTKPGKKPPAKPPAQAQQQQIQPQDFANKYFK